MSIAHDVCGIACSVTADQEAKVILLFYFVVSDLPRLHGLTSGPANVNPYPRWGGGGGCGSSPLISNSIKLEVTKEPCIALNREPPNTPARAANFGMLGDIIIVEPNAYIAFAGAPVIREKEKGFTVSKPGAKRRDWISPIIRSVGNHEAQQAL
ncbi:hypothetical protein CRG98_014112 [Punica granatum]|uniref:Uncharacterized protein n=1 Tax=Punica granatum TaxID=22663 RepID=A0A2I0KAE4_PUNGR|nr:hypothetical protein CRG98_014112 [Punica granatum]